MGRNGEGLSRYLVRSLTVYTLVLGLSTMLTESVFTLLVSKLPGQQPGGLHIAVYLVTDIGLYTLFVLLFSRVMRRRIRQQSEAQLRERLRLMADLGHDLRTPLTSIRGFSRALSTGRMQAEEERREAAETIHRKALEMEEMLGEMLDYARAGHAGTAPRPEPVRVNALLRAVIAEHYADFEEKSMTLACELQEDAPVLVEGQRFRRAFENILLNALRHCPPGSAVLVRTERIRRGFQKRLRILVADNGLDIPLAQRKRIFEPFVRLDESRGGQGYGLGLSIARDCAEQAGGRLMIAPMPPPYTKAFVMELPLKENKQKADR